MSEIIKKINNKNLENLHTISVLQIIACIYKFISKKIIIL